MHFSLQVRIDAELAAIAVGLLDGGEHGVELLTVIHASVEDDCVDGSGVLNGGEWILIEYDQIGTATCFND